MSEVLLEKSGANYFGFETIDVNGKKRREQNVVRGNGLLTLTAGELRFARAVPPVEITVPIELVEWTRMAKAHNGKSFGFLPVLQVAFRTPTETRVFGACVGKRSEAEVWLEAIESLVAQRTSPAQQA